MLHGKAFKKVKLHNNFEYFGKYLSYLNPGIHDIFLVKNYRQMRQENCSDIKFSTLVAGSVSNLLLTSNSSLNFVIYALMSREFTQLLLKKTKKCQLFCCKNPNELEGMELKETNTIKEQKSEQKQKIKPTQNSISSISHDKLKPVDSAESCV